MRCLVHYSGSRSASPVSVDRSLPPAQSLSQGPSTSVYNANLMTSAMRPDPRYELALASQVPHTQTEHPDTSAVAVTSTRALQTDRLTYGKATSIAAVAFLRNARWKYMNICSILLIVNSCFQGLSTGHIIEGPVLQDSSKNQSNSSTMSKYTVSQKCSTPYSWR